MSCRIFGESLPTAFVAKYCGAIRWPQWRRQPERIMVGSSVSVFRAVVFERGGDMSDRVVNRFVGHNGDVNVGEFVDWASRVKTFFGFATRAAEWTVFGG